MDVDGRSGITRRKAIQGGALAVGIAWSAPTVRSIKLLAATGSPSPSSSSSTTEPSPQTYRLDGPLDDFISAPAPTPDCPEGQHWTFTFHVPDLGAIAVAFDVCDTALADLFNGVQVGPSPFTLTDAVDAVSGTMVGMLGPVQNPPTGGFLPFHFDLSIEQGTGTFSNAVGSATIDIKIDPLHFPTTTGQIAGSFTA